MYNTRNNHKQTNERVGHESKPRFEKKKLMRKIPGAFKQNDEKMGLTKMNDKVGWDTNKYLPPSPTVYSTMFFKELHIYIQLAHILRLDTRILVCQS